MKVGTLVEHRAWGKGIVIEILTHLCHTPIKVCWLNPRRRAKMREVATSYVSQKLVTIISEGE